MKNTAETVSGSAVKETEGDWALSEKKIKKKIIYKVGRILLALITVAAFFGMSVSELFCREAEREGFYAEVTPMEAAGPYLDRIAQEITSHLVELVAAESDDTVIKDYLVSQGVDVQLYRYKGVYPMWGTNSEPYKPKITLQVELNYYEETGRDIWCGFYISPNDRYYCVYYMRPDCPADAPIREASDSLQTLHDKWGTAMRTATAMEIAFALCIGLRLFLFLKKRRKRHEKREREPGFLVWRLAAPSVCAVGIILTERLMERGIIDWQFFPRILLRSTAATLILVAVLLQGTSVSRFFYRVFRWILRKAGRVICSILRKFPPLPSGILLYVGGSGLELFLCFRTKWYWALAVWIVEKAVVLGAGVYLFVCGKRFLAAGELLAQGELDHEVNTAGMAGPLRRHGENLNSIGQGISRAVEAKMKSERMKTELITNVSHDIKTPLTSIINYSRLIGDQKTENETITEYAQVLLRQAERMKKLLDDLIEASKAASGSMEVHFAPCEVDVLLSQAVGEYQSRLEEKQLELRTVQPEETIRILADGQLLWRVFDNLFNNVYKYAQEGSRVYLNVEKAQDSVRIIFRNMSKFALNISAEELEERFVRGDKSRHMEGSGLGLAITRSLVELQNGRMELLVDGDLFKVTLLFGLLEDEDGTNADNR